MLDWPGNYEKMTLHSNFKLRFSKTSCKAVSGFLFKFGVITKVWLSKSNCILYKEIVDWTGIAKK